MEFLKKQFQEFIAGLMSLPINIPGSRLYRSLQASSSNYLISILFNMYSYNLSFEFYFQAKKKMVKLVKKTIQARKSTSGISNIPKDVIDVLLSDRSEQLTDDLIANNMIDMMIPGEDSVPVLMTLAVKYLSDCPAALQQLMVCNFILFFPLYQVELHSQSHY